MFIISMIGARRSARFFSLPAALFFAFFLLLSCVSPPASAAAPGEKPERSMTLKVMSINIRHNSDFWEERFPLIADEIVRLEPDLIGLQEVEIGIDQSAKLLELVSEKSGADLEYRVYERLKTGGSFISGEGIAIFSRFPIAASDFADLEHGRPVLLARIRLAKGLAVDIYNTHLHHRGGDDVRLPQARKIAAFMKKRNAGLITFLTGDMNARPDSPNIEFIRSLGFVDTFRAAYPDTEAVTGNTSPVIMSKNKFPQNFVQRIDYVFMKPAEGETDTPGIEVVDSVVCFKSPRGDGLYPSDHLGVMTTFEIVY